jgi:hypothetical protein
VLREAQTGERLDAGGVDRTSLVVQAWHVKISARRLASRRRAVLRSLRNTRCAVVELKLTHTRVARFVLDTTPASCVTT